MKRTFMKFLPIAAAVLLATSCSKDEGNTVVDNVVTPDPVQEVAEQPTVKTIKIIGKLSQNSLSKVTTSGTNNRTLVFKGGEEFSFSNGKVKGMIEITAADGTYTADITFSDEESLLASAGFTASIGNVPDGQKAYASLTEAVEFAYYTIDFKVKKEGTDSYSLTQKDSDAAIKVENNSAFIYVRGVVASGEISFEGGTPITSPAVGKYYIVPADVKMGTSDNKTVAGKIYNVGKAGFSVNVSGDKVEFAPGNLQYRASDGKWRFADNQWDYCGGTEEGEFNGNVTDGSNDNPSADNNKWIDLFGWGMWLDEIVDKTKITNISDDAHEYAPNLTTESLQVFANNETTVDGEKWRTLTSAEWEYIFNTESRGTTRYAKAMVCGVRGVVVLPDNWNGGYDFGEDFVNKFSLFGEWKDAVSIDKDDWEKILEKQGAVFLPAAGCREVASMKNVGSYGYYWSSTADSWSSAYTVLYFEGNLFPTYHDRRDYGESVRLVRDL